MSHKVLGKLVDIAANYIVLEPYEDPMEGGEKDG